MKHLTKLIAAATIAVSSFAGAANANVDGDKGEPKPFMLKVGAALTPQTAVIPFAAAKDTQIMKVGGSDLQCLTEALYFEARGESERGQMAVAEVIINRARSGKFPNSICGVVNQGVSNGKYRCQFSYKCDGRSDSMGNRSMVSRLNALANRMLSSGGAGITGGATYYHTTAVRPSWSRRLTRTTQVGPHLFYR
ncbi:cell wall hydrolase [Paracoccaceae bacterium GXU_MW_L88]